MKFRQWLKGLLGAVIGGISTAGTMCFIDPATFNFTHEGWTKVARLLVVSGLVSLFAYLKKSPMPPDEPETKETTTITVEKTSAAAPATHEKATPASSPGAPIE
jgi:hypothetical protein